MNVAYAIGYFAASVWVCLPLIYWFTAPEFYRTYIGRTVMMLLASTASLFLLLLTYGFFGDYALRPYVNGTIYALVLIAGFRMAIMFFQLRFGSEQLKERITNGSGTSSKAGH